MRLRIEWVLAVTLAMAAGCNLGKPAPAAYSRCEKCHGFPGGGDRIGGPDLRDSTYTFEQFKTQVIKGSDWSPRPQVRRPYKYKKMPAQVGVAEESLPELYKYIKGES